ncbi:hypothetical protein CDAR_171821 [Caerostris darwini]|uniref:DUF4817 domain-containing protein n=1 Tax=Caerostris darwini TaxID=1538125 RepID=A0AAV4MMR3_9ARAC|nr:hypothetical protein CDAR_171821 [Caerostris darwini]
MLSIVEKALLVKLYYKNSESAIVELRAYRYMKGMRDSKGPITSSALKKRMKKSEATGCLASRSRLFGVKWTFINSRCCCHDSEANGAIHVGGCCTWGLQCSRSFEADRSVVRQCLESIANNSETVSLQVAT